MNVILVKAKPYAPDLNHHTARDYSRGRPSLLGQVPPPGTPPGGASTSRAAWRSERRNEQRSKPTSKRRSNRRNAVGRLLDTFGDEPRMHRRVPVPRVGSGVYWIRGELGFCLTGPTLTLHHGAFWKLCPCTHVLVPFLVSAKRMEGYGEVSAAALHPSKLRGREHRTTLPADR